MLGPQPVPSEGSGPACSPSSSGKSAGLSPAPPPTPPHPQGSSEASNLPALPAAQFPAGSLSFIFGLCCLPITQPSRPRPRRTVPVGLSPHPPHLRVPAQPLPLLLPPAASLLASSRCQHVAGLQLQAPGEGQVCPCVTHGEALAGAQQHIPGAPVRRRVRP